MIGGFIVGGSETKDALADGFVRAASEQRTVILDTLGSTLPGYGSLPFALNEDFNIAQGLIFKVGR